MTENLAGRGEGLRGLLRAKVYSTDYEEVVSWKDILAALEAAAPPSTAPTRERLAQAICEFHQHSRWSKDGETPSSMATASSNPGVAEFNEKCICRIERLGNFGNYKRWRDKDCPIHGEKEPVPAATQEQPAGSALDRERREGLYLKFSEPLMEPHTPVIIERVNGDCTVSKFIIARDEAHKLINQLCEFLGGSPRKVGEDGAEQPYFIEVDDSGCRHCDAGKTWIVVAPDGAGGGTSYGDEEAAQEVADLMNDAYHVGKASAEI